MSASKSPRTPSNRESVLSRYQLLAENTRDIFLFVRVQDGQILDANKAAVRAYGYAYDDLLAMSIVDLDAPGVSSVFSSRLKKPSSGGILFETTQQRKDGSCFAVEVSMQEAHLEDEAVVVCVIRDISRRKQVEESLQRQVQRLAGLRSIDTAIAASANLGLIFKILLEQVLCLLGVDAADLLTPTPYGDRLEYQAGAGFRVPVGRAYAISANEEFARQVILDRRTLVLESPPEIGRCRRIKEAPGEDFVFYAAAPVIIRGQVLGMLEAFRRSPYQPAEDWIAFLETLAGQAAIALDNADLAARMQRTNADLVQACEETISGWSRALDMRDREPPGHTERVTDHTVHLAEAMGIDEDELVHIRRGAILHDIGKVGIPDYVLLKPGSLSMEEWTTMRRHPEIAYQLLAPISFLQPALDIPYCHHERWDGKGYPRSLKGETIPIAARIFAVIDVWDSLRADRPYRRGWDEDKVFEFIKEQAGHMFDPAVVDAFQRIYKSL